MFQKKRFTCRINESIILGVPEYRSSRIQGFQNAGFTEYRDPENTGSRIQKVQNTGVPEYRVSRIHVFHNTDG